MSPLVAYIYNKHVNKILKSEEYYRLYNEAKSPMHARVSDQPTAAEVKQFKKSVIDTCTRLGIKPVIKKDNCNV